MKILIVHDYGTLNGGAEYMSQTLRDGLRDRGHESVYFSSSARPVDIPIVADETCYGSMGLDRRVLQVANPHAALRLGQVIRQFRPDVVHLRMFMTELSPLILPLLEGIPSVLHVVNYDLICPLNTKLLPDGTRCSYRQGVMCLKSGCLPIHGLARLIVQQWLWRRWSGVIDRVVANSRWVRKRLEDDGLQVDDVIWNGVPESPRRSVLAETPLIAFAGRMFPKKGIDVLLHAMRRVTARIPDVRLIIAGDGPERAALSRLAAELGLNDSLTWLGHLPRKELNNAIGEAWVQVVPSAWEEPFGLAAAESMMRGTAVICSDVGGLSEQVIENKTGFLVPPGDPDALAERLCQVLGDRGLAARMGSAGREHALAHFTEDRAVDQFVGLYEELATGTAAWQRDKRTSPRGTGSALR